MAIHTDFTTLAEQGDVTGPLLERRGVIGGDTRIVKLQEPTVHLVSIFHARTLGSADYHRPSLTSGSLSKFIQESDSVKSPLANIMASTRAGRQLLSTSIRHNSRSQPTSFEAPTRCLSTTAIQKANSSQTKLLGSSLRDSDPQIFQILENEKQRQRHFINLIPSENFTSLAVLEALGSVMQSKPLSCPNRARC